MYALPPEPTLSVIIPVVNEAENLKRLLPWLIQHGGNRLSEIIVSDGSSEDDSQEVAASFGVKVVVSKVRSRAVQMNLGVKHAGGDILYFVHADTLPPASYADDIIKFANLGYPVGCYRFKFDSPKWYLKINNFFTRFDRPWCRGGDQTLYILNSLFNGLGGFDERMAIMEEYEFLDRVRKQHAFKIMPGDVLVSSRKYAGVNYFRVQWANFVAFRSFRRGEDTGEIKERYYQMLRHVQR